MLHNNMQIALRFSIFKFTTCNLKKTGYSAKGYTLNIKLRTVVFILFEYSIRQRYEREPRSGF